MQAGWDAALLLEERNLSGRWLLQPTVGPPQVLQRDTVKTLAEHCLERILPARLDSDALPQSPEAVELMLVEPGVHLARAADLLLQQLEGRLARVKR